MYLLTRKIKIISTAFFPLYNIFFSRYKYLYNYLLRVFGSIHTDKLISPISGLQLFTSFTYIITIWWKKLFCPGIIRIHLIFFKNLLLNVKVPRIQSCTKDRDCSKMNILIVSAMVGTSRLIMANHWLNQRKRL